LRLDPLRPPAAERRVEVAGLRQVGRMEARLKEAAKLGFGRALAAPPAGDSALPVIGVSRLSEAVSRIGDQLWDARA